MKNIRPIRPDVVTIYTVMEMNSKLLYMLLVNTAFKKLLEFLEFVMCFFIGTALQFGGKKNKAVKNIFFPSICQTCDIFHTTASLKVFVKNSSLFAQNFVNVLEVEVIGLQFLFCIESCACKRCFFNLLTKSN